MAKYSLASWLDNKQYKANDMKKLSKKAARKQMLDLEIQEGQELYRKKKGGNLKQDVQELICLSLEKIKDSHLESFSLPPIYRYHFSRPFPYTEQWSLAREWMKVSPVVWKDLSIYLNLLGLGYLEIVRATVREELLSVNLPDEESKRYLKTVTNSNSVRRLFPLGYFDSKDKLYGRVYPLNETEQHTSILNLRSSLKKEVLKELQTWLVA